MSDEKQILVKPENEQPSKWNRILLFGGIGLVLFILFATITFSATDEKPKRDSKNPTTTSQPKDSKMGDQAFNDSLKQGLSEEEKAKQEAGKKDNNPTNKTGQTTTTTNTNNNSPAPTYVQSTTAKQLTPEEKYAQDKRQRELDRQEQAAVQRENQDIEAQRSGIFVNLPQQTQQKEAQNSNQSTNQTINDYYNNASNNTYIQVVGGNDNRSRQGGYNR